MKCTIFSIFGEVGDYVPSFEKREKSKSEKNADAEKRKSYFEKPRTDVISLFNYFFYS